VNTKFPGVITITDEHLLSQTVTDDPGRCLVVAFLRPVHILAQINIYQLTAIIHILTDYGYIYFWYVIYFSLNYVTVENENKIVTV
jgi:hypothetical protein